MENPTEFFRKTLNEFRAADDSLSKQLKLSEDTAAARQIETKKRARESELAATSYLQMIEGKDSGSVNFTVSKISPQIDSDLAKLKSLAAEVSGNKVELNQLLFEIEALKKEFQAALLKEKTDRTKRIIRRAVIGAAALCALIALHFWLLGKTSLFFTLSLDGKNLPSEMSPNITVDGKSFAAGNKINLGRHQIAIAFPGGEAFAKRTWTFYGKNDLGILPLESSKGSLLVTVMPSPATVVVEREGKIISQGDAPLKIEKLPVGDYAVLIHRGEYEESRSVKIERQQQTETNIDLNLGVVQLFSDTSETDFELSGNGRQWYGKLPIKIDDVPGGNYSLVVSRKGWEQTADISISRGSITSNKTEFPYGSIEVTSDPTGLVISTNGVEIGKTPIILTELKPGQYSLTASDGENDLMADISVAPKEAAKHAFVFRYGTVQLSSTPAGATVIRKGREIGTTPLLLNHIPAGETTVELQLQDYVSTNFQIQAMAGVTTNLSTKLISKRYLQSMKQAQETFDAAQFSESQKFLTVALESEPNDPAAMELQDEVSKAVAKAEEAQKEAEHIAEIERKEAEHQEIVAIIEKAISAVGGREAIDRFRFYKAVFNSTGKKAGNEFTMRTTVYIQLPDKYRVDQEVANQPKKLNILGVNIGTVTTDQGKPVQSTFCVTENGSWEVIQTILGVVQQPVSQETEKLFRHSLYLTECTSLVPLLGPEYILEKIPNFPSAPDGTVAIKVQKVGQPDVVLFFDEDSGLLAGLYDEGLDEHGRTFQEGERFSEYRNFSGLACATITTFLSGNTSSVGTLESLEPLSPYQENVFDPPQSPQR